MGKLPDRIDKYKIEELVAEGGMGAVYKAVHPTLERPVILKKLTLRGNTTVTERFKREARILLDFRNDHIVDVQDHFIQGRSHYIVMEYIDGPSVKELIEDQRYLDNCTAAYITLFTAKALKYAHTKGVVHRDIKPGNILISKAGEIKLADFGIASARNPDTGEDTLTTDGTTLGTPAYMAPEQFENSKTADYRADLYSLGVMLYEMLTGVKPFPGGFTPDTLRQIQKGKYRKPSKLNPSITPALQKIIKKLIKPKPERRLKSIDRLIEMLEKYLAVYRKEDLKEHLCALLRDETSDPVKPVKKIKAGLISILSALLAAAVLSGAWYCSITDIHRKVLSPYLYGQLSFTIETSGQDLKTEPATRVFIDDDSEIPPAEKEIRFLKINEKLRSIPVCLPSGKYRSKTVVGSSIVWNSFELKPWSDTKKTFGVKVFVPEAAPADVRVTSLILDASDGWDLSGRAKFEVYADGKFIPVEDARIKSGGVYNFRITAEGYEEQEWVLEIKPSQYNLHFQTGLFPKDELKDNK